MKRLALIISLIVIIAGCGEIKSSSEQEFGHFELYKIPGGKILIDKDTGCQYIRGLYGDASYTPRLTSEGKPMCGKE